MRRYAAFVLACGLLLAGCGSTVQYKAQVGSGLTTDGSAGALGNDGLGGQPTASTGPNPLGTQPTGNVSQEPGVTATGPNDGSGGGPNPLPSTGAPGAPKPISIGFFNNNNSTINSQYGYSVAQGQDVDKALVQGINASHGLVGHKVVAHYSEYSANSNNYASDAAAACQTFTHDTPVSIVISPTISTEYGFADCLQAKGILLESASWTDAHSYASHPLLFSATGSTFERGYITALDQLHASGNVTAKNHLGVFLENCPEDARAWTNGIQPEIHKLGIPVELSTLSCTGGISDAGTASAAMQSAILKWQGTGVDRIMFVTVYESTLLVLFASAAESQNYRPGYVLTSLAEASGVAAGSSYLPGQKPGLRGAGTAPGFDVDAPPAPSAVEKRCLALALAGGLQVSAAFDRETLFQHCASLLLIEAALKASSAAPTNTEIRNAIFALGSRVLLPGLVEDRAYLDGNRHDAPSHAREFGWQASCSCIKYLAAAAPMTG